MGTLRLDEDWHVHANLTDCAEIFQQRIAAAAARGLARVGCVARVQRDTTQVADYVAAATAARATSEMALSIGIEAAIVDRSGLLDLPASLDGVELVYAADHVFPGVDGPIAPAVIKESIAAGERDAHAVLDGLVQATMAAMLAHAGERRLVLAHPFDIVPKLGLSEDDIRDGALAELASSAARTGTIVEVNESRRCPSQRMVRACKAHGGQVVASSGADRAADIGAYGYVKAIAAALG